MSNNSIYRFYFLFQWVVLFLFVLCTFPQRFLFIQVQPYCFPFLWKWMKLERCVLLRESTSSKHFTKNTGIIKKIFPTNTTTWANIGFSNFCNTVCSSSINFKCLVRAIGTENILLFCVTRVTLQFSWSALVWLFSRCVPRSTEVSPRPLFSVIHVHEVFLFLTTYLSDDRFSSYMSPKKQCITINWMPKQEWKPKYLH